jgi:hypothetical protein
MSRDLKMAMADAGYKLSSERLDDAAQAAVAASKGNFNRAVDALTKAVRADAGVVWELWGRHPALSRWDAVKAEIRAFAVVNAVREEGATSALPTGHGRNAPSNPPRASAAALCAVSQAARASILDRQINGQKLRDLSVDEARRWGNSRARDARFVELLTANLPPVGRIGDYRSDDDAEKIWVMSGDGE